MGKKKLKENLKKVNYGEARNCSNCRKVTSFKIVRDSPYNYYCNVFEMPTNEEMVCGVHTFKE